MTDLTTTEKRIIAILERNPGKVVTRGEMLENIRGAGAINMNVSTVDKHIANLRKKLGGAGKRIRSVYGSGYMWE